MTPPPPRAAALPGGEPDPANRRPGTHHRYPGGLRGYYEPHPQTNDAYDAATDSYSYLPCFQYVRPWIESADYAVANFETTLNGPPYSGYPQFCAPDALAYGVQAIGFDLVTTANNHCMDKGYNGLVRTLDTLDAAGLKHVGTYRTQEEFDANKGVVVADVGGISVAFLGYTYGTNGIPVAQDKDFSLNRFNTDYQAECVTLDQEKLKNELALRGKPERRPHRGDDPLGRGISDHPERLPEPSGRLPHLQRRRPDSGQPLPRAPAYGHPDGHPGRRHHPVGLRVLFSGEFCLNQSPATVNVNYTDTTAVLNLS